MLGSGDVDYMDPNISYYSIGYLGLRQWSRQLFTYPARTVRRRSAVPDLATAADDRQGASAPTARPTRSRIRKRRQVEHHPAAPGDGRTTWSAA